MNQDYEETSVFCPYCKAEKLKKDLRIVLTSDPPQYHYGCLKCKRTWSAFSEDDLMMRIEMYKKAQNDQEAKADAGKPRLTLVPRQIIWDIATIREYGTKKYKDPDNWKRVEIERYRDAAYRHFMAYLDDPKSVDKESGFPHLWHLACNISFLCELEKEVPVNETLLRYMR